MLKKIENVKGILTGEKSKNKLLIFITVFIISLVMCSAFLQAHYPHETYKIKIIGYTKYSKLYFLKEGRPFTAILTILMDILHIPVETYSLISFIIALIFLSISVTKLYFMLKNKIKNSSKRTLFIVTIINFIFDYNELFLHRIYIFYGM